MTTMNTNRKRNDAMASVAVDDATEFDAGALMFLDTDDAKPASSQADQLSESANQRLFAQKFMGAAAGGKLSTETHKDKVLIDFDLTAEREYDCVSETHEIGDLLGVDEASSGTALEDKKLVKVTDPALAIAVCVRKDAAAATKVRCKFIKSILVGVPTDVRLASLAVALTGDLTMTKYSARVLALDPGGASKDIRLPPEADSYGAILFIANTADAAEDLVVTDDGDTYTVATISQNQVGFFFCDGAKWYGGMGPQT
jgi:hypothetical protein